MALDDHLARAYAYRNKLDGVTVDPAPACAAAGFDMAELTARRDALAAVPKGRCIVSAVQREFLDRVISLRS